MGSIQYSTSLDYPITAPDGTEIMPKDNNSGKKACWRWSQSKFQWGVENDFIVIKKDSNSIWTVYTKQYLNCDNEGNTIHRTQRPEAVIEQFSSTQASKNMDRLGLGSYFDYTKPVELIKYLISKIETKNEIVLDFFSGSSTTADAVMQMNVLSNSRTQYIMVQLPELLDKKSEAYRAGYRNIADIGKERIRRAAKKIAEENPDKANELDLGFKVFKLDTSNIKGWDGSTENLEQTLFDAQDNIKEDRTEEDVLYEVLIKYGLNLTLPIEEMTIAGKKVFSVGYGALFICLANSITRDVAEGIGKWKEELKPITCRVIFKDSGFTDVEKTNSVQTLKRFGIHEIKSI